MFYRHKLIYNSAEKQEYNICRGIKRDQEQEVKKNEMQQGIITILLLVVSNTFMTLAWYGHLKLQQGGHTSNWPLIGVILLSWGIALLEYCAQVPANRIGFRENGGPFSLFQLKIIQEAISLTVFTVMATMMFKGETLHWNHLVAFCFILLAVFFAFMKVE